MQLQAGGEINQSTVEVDGLIIRPNEGDAVKFAGDDTYYTIASATSLFTTSNPGSYNQASALLTLNKAYIGVEVVDWVNTTYPGLTYDTVKCARDVELIVAAIAQDLIDGGVEESDKAGRLYWAGTQSQVIGQVDETAAAVGQIAQVAAQVLAQTAIGMVTSGALTAEVGASTTVQGLTTDIQRTILRDTTGKSVITLEENLATAKTNNTPVGFHLRSLIGASSHTFEYVGTGNSMEQAVPYLGGRGIQANEVIEDTITSEEPEEESFGVILDDAKIDEGIEKVDEIEEDLTPEEIKEVKKKIQREINTQAIKRDGWLDDIDNKR